MRLPLEINTKETNSSLSLFLDFPHRWVFECHFALSEENNEDAIDASVCIMQEGRKWSERDWDVTCNALNLLKFTFALHFKMNAWEDFVMKSDQWLIFRNAIFFLWFILFPCGYWYFSQMALKSSKSICPKPLRGTLNLKFPLHPLIIQQSTSYWTKIISHWKSCIKTPSIIFLAPLRLHHCV